MAMEEHAADGRPGLLSELEEYCFDTGGFVVIRSRAHPLPELEHPGRLGQRLGQTES